MLDPVPPANPGGNRHVSRRRFLKTSAAIGAFTFLPARTLFGQNTPNERVRLAAVGIGNQGLNDLKALDRSGICDVVALCDVHLSGEHTQEAQSLFSKAKRYSDFRKLFDEYADQFDAVLISTPDHSHFSITMLAMSLGKHVFVEKPLAHTFGQVERMMDLAKRGGVVTQMGNQGHSGANYFQFKAWTEAGFIKDVKRVTAYMNEERRWHGWGTSVTEYPTQPMPDDLAWDVWADYAPVHPFSDRLHPQEWRSWFDYGSGAFGDWGPHILDTVHEFLELDLPAKIVAEKRDGRNDLVYPQASTIRFDFPKRKDMPACKVTWYDGTNNLPPVEKELGTLETDEATGKSKRAPLEIGQPGKIIYAKDYTFKGNSHSDTLQVVPFEKWMDTRRDFPRFPQKNSNHYENFLLACKGEEKTRSPFSISGPLTQVFNLGIIAQRLGGSLKFDPKKKQFTNNRAANALLDPAPRDGWESYYKL